MLEPLAEKLITSADSLLAAASKEILVRVESSANKLTTVLPRRVGSFLICPSLTRDSSVAVSKIPTASCTFKSAIESKCFIVLSDSR